MMTTEFSGYITGREPSLNSTNDGKTHFLNFGIAFYGGKNREGQTYSDFVDISIVSDDLSRLEKIIAIVKKGNFVTGRGKYHQKTVYVGEGLKKKAKESKSIKCRPESIQLINCTKAEPIGLDDALGKILPFLEQAITQKQTLESFYTDCLCVLNHIECIDENPELLSQKNDFLGLNSKKGFEFVESTDVAEETETAKDTFAEDLLIVD